MRRNPVAWAALVVSVAALVGSRGYTRPLPAAQELPADGQKAARALSEAFGAVADFVKPSVVQITIQKKGGGLRLGRSAPAPGTPGRPQNPKDLEEMFKRFFGPDFKFEEQQFTAQGTGSGFVYDDKGHILTNNHVVAGADKITVTFHDGVEATAKVVGTFAEADVAVIKVETSGYRPVQVGKSKGLRVGEWVLAVGSPFGLSQTVTAGIISATERDNVDINQFESFIQTDASINPGNSGGPLVDMNGRVVGINSAIATMTRANAGVGFAIPIDMAARLADKLIQSGKVNRALMGVFVEPLTPALARQLGVEPKTKGVVVMNIGPDTPAAKAGLKKGDIILTYDGNPVSSRKGLQYLVQTSDVGKSYEVTYLRDGQKKTTTVAPGEFDRIAREMEPAGAPSGGSARPKAVAAAPKFDDFGLAVAPLDSELATKYGYSEKDSGLVVTAVKDDSPAAAAGLEVGDLITEVVRDKKFHPIKSAKEFADFASRADEIALSVRDTKSNPAGTVVTLAKPKKG